MTKDKTSSRTTVETNLLDNQANATTPHVNLASAANTQIKTTKETQETIK